MREPTIRFVMKFKGPKCVDDALVFADMLEEYGWLGADELREKAHDAYEQLVDRLLGSRHFGERWGRHWLDVVGYTDTIGDDTDAAITKLGSGKWRYRDYVIQAFNDDKPYDRFLIEQFAGDEL